MHQSVEPIRYHRKAFKSRCKMRRIFIYLLTINQYVIGSFSANDNMLSVMEEEEEQRRAKEESELIFEAGCKKKQILDSNDSNSTKYKWIPSGTLLERGVCIDRNYRSYIAPQEDGTKVYATINYQKIRDVDDKLKTISIDLLLTLRWQDTDIRTNFTEKMKQNDGLSIRQKMSKIWTPGLYIWNRTSVKPKEEWAALTKSRILTTNQFKNEETGSWGAFVELKYEVKTTIYCNFDYTQYPMDSQMCSVKIDGDSDNAIFILYDPSSAFHTNRTYKAVGLVMDIVFFGGENGFDADSVGFSVRMKRLIRPYMLKYYIPCMAIVFVSEIGFMVPLTAIPGRVALLVTQFLTLINLFIFQMSESPSSSDLNILGEYLLVSLGFVVATIAEFALVVLLNRKEKLNHDNKNLTNSNEKKDYGLVRVFKIREIDESKNIDLMNSTEKPQWKRPSIYVVDFVAFWIHLSSFILYNMIYWVQHHY